MRPRSGVCNQYQGFEAGKLCDQSSWHFLSPMMSASDIVFFYPFTLYTLVLCHNLISYKVNENIEHLETTRYISSITCLCEGHHQKNLQLRTSLPHLTHVAPECWAGRRMISVWYFTSEFIDGAMQVISVRIATSLFLTHTGRTCPYVYLIFSNKTGPVMG